MSTTRDGFDGGILTSMLIGTAIPGDVGARVFFDQTSYDDGYAAGYIAGYAAGYAAGYGTAPLLPPGFRMGYLGGYLGAPIVAVNEEQVGPDAVPAPFTSGDPEFVDIVQGAFDLLPFQFKGSE